MSMRWYMSQKLQIIGTLFICVLFAIRAVFIATLGYPVSVKIKSVPVSYAPPPTSNDATNNNDNTFLATFERVIGSANLSLPPGHNAHVPLMIESSNDGKTTRVLCRKSHKDVISNARVRSYIEMLNTGKEEMVDLHYGFGRMKHVYFGFRSNDKAATSGGRSGLPVILIESDSSGCESRVDEVSFPRLTWHTPSPKFGAGWCEAIGMVGYESWNAFRNKNTHCRDTYWSSFFDHTSCWERTFTKYQRKYPWSSKINKAIWRGSTTGQHFPFDNLPRAKLVKNSNERPDLIDAGFTSFVQQGYESMKNNNSTTTMMMAKSVRFEDQMRYKAIIDIDGNTWSSRFSKLLCTNSVVIKIDPDYIEYFYNDIHPMKHYVPASLANITEVTEYVMSKANEMEMKSIVENANLWCQKTNTREQLARDAVAQLKKYEVALYAAYNGSWVEEWKSVRRRIWRNIGDDLIDCSF